MQIGGRGGSDEVEPGALPPEMSHYTLSGNIPKLYVLVPRPQYRDFNFKYDDPTDPERALFWSSSLVY